MNRAARAAGAGGGADARAVSAVSVSGVAVYRGWMLSAEAYAAFAGLLAARGVALRTSPSDYRRAHELPGWYDALASVTPASLWASGSDAVDFDRARVSLGAGPAVLRDYTKSMKHYWDEAAYIPSLELRGDDFAGGIVLRRFERFTSAEVRTWWVAGACVLVGPHPDTPGDVPPSDLDLSAVAPLVARLGLPFVAVDLALRADGVWRVIETRRRTGQRPPVHGRTRGVDRRHPRLGSPRGDQGLGGPVRRGADARRQRDGSAGAR